MTHLRRLFSRSDLSFKDVKVLRGIFRQVNWALGEGEGRGEGEFKTSADDLDMDEIPAPPAAQAPPAVSALEEEERPTDDSRRSFLKDGSPEKKMMNRTPTTGDPEKLADFIRVARGDKPADLVLRGGKVVDVFSGEIRETGVAVYRGRDRRAGRLRGQRDPRSRRPLRFPGLHRRPLPHRKLPAAPGRVCPGCCPARDDHRRRRPA